MQKKMILYFSSDSLEKVTWILLNENHSLTTPSPTEKNIPAQHITATEIVVIIPTQNVLLIEANVPTTLNRIRLQQTVPFAIEEYVIDDIASCHFAIGKPLEKNKVPVAVISHEKMKYWIQALKQFHSAPSLLLPDIFLLPYSETHWYINSIENNSIVRTGKYSGFSCETKNLDSLIPASTQVIHTHFSEQELIEKIALRLEETPHINLLQKPYFPQVKKTVAKKIWQLAGIVTAGWIALAFFSQLISLFMLSYQTHHLKTEMTALYEKHFSYVTSPDLFKQKMSEKLHRLEQEEGKNHFLNWLSTFATLSSQTPGIHLQHIDYHENQLIVNVAAPTFDLLDTLATKIAGQGLTIRQENTETLGSQVITTFVIRGTT